MSETKQALNIYGVLDNELARLHRLVETYAVHAERSSRDLRYGMGHHNNYPTAPDAHAIYARILEIQGVMLAAVAGSDAKIQEAVAELALTGKNFGPSSPPDEIPF